MMTLWYRLHRMLVIHSMRVMDTPLLTCCSSAPSAAPTSVRESAVTSSSITVQWGAVNCIHHNGDITDYSVRYRVQGTAEGDRTVKMATGDSSGGMYTISGLSAATVYTVEVAAVNSVGTGVYSDLLTSLTSGTALVCANTIHQDLSLFPVEPPVLSLASPTEAFTISLSWTSAGPVVSSYEVAWQRDTSGECPDEDEGSTTITDGSTNYEIMGLAGISSYTISVRASNEAGTALSNTLTVMTIAAGT